MINCFRSNITGFIYKNQLRLCSTVSKLVKATVNRQPSPMVDSRLMFLTLADTYRPAEEDKKRVWKEVGPIILEDMKSYLDLKVTLQCESGHFSSQELQRIYHTFMDDQEKSEIAVKSFEHYSLSDLSVDFSIYPLIVSKVFGSDKEKEYDHKIVKLMEKYMNAINYSSGPADELAISNVRKNLKLITEKFTEIRRK